MTAPSQQITLDTVDGLSLSAQIKLLSGAGFWRTEAMPGSDIGALVLADGPHGLRTQRGSGDHLGVGTSEPATCFPPAVTLASAWDEDLAREVGRAVGTEARALGVDVVLGPGMNIKRHPLCGRNFEYFSEDPLLSGRLAAAVVDGIQATGVAACLKHFAVNNQEGHRFVVDAVVDERTLRELYLAGFEHAVSSSAPRAMMASYNKVNGVPAASHPHLLKDILRDGWGYDGLLMSDWGGAGDRVDSVQAGLDLEMPGSKGLYDGELAEAAASRPSVREAVRTSARRVAALARQAAAPGDDPIPVDAHDQLATRAAVEGTVLLTNDGVLPLRQPRRVAVIGAFAKHPRYQGSGSSMVNPLRVTTLLDALEERDIQVTYAPGYDPVTSSMDRGLVEDAVEAARGADAVVVMVGLPGRYESEGFDREDLLLPAQHDALVEAVCAAHPRTVVTLSNGAPVLMPWRDDAAAIVESYLGGQASGSALAAVLLGDSDPGGRLAETFPGRQADVSSDRWFPGSPRQVHYREGLFVGYRHHVTAGIEPLFPFGHGLSYTEFDWTDPTVEKGEVSPGEDLAVSVTVTNTGSRAGSEVVQVYLSDRTGVVLRPERQLAGFAKVRLDPGESRRVEVLVPSRAFEFFDVRSDRWQVPRGGFEVLIARSSSTVLHRLPVSMTAGVESATEPVGTEPIAATDAQFRRRLGRSVPPVVPPRPFTRDSTIEELAVSPLGRGLRALLVRASAVGDLEEMNPSTRLMLERSIAGLPLRAAAVFAQGRLKLPVVDLIVAAGNRDLRAIAGVVATGLRPLREVTSHLRRATSRPADTERNPKGKP